MGRQELCGHRPSASNQLNANIAGDSSDGNPHLTLLVRINANVRDVIITAEVSSDLQTWQLSPGAVKLASDPAAKGIRTLIFRDAGTAKAGNNCFMRLRATQP